MTLELKSNNLRIQKIENEYFDYMINFIGEYDYIIDMEFENGKYTFHLGAKICGGEINDTTYKYKVNDIVIELKEKYNINEYVNYLSKLKIEIYVNKGNDLMLYDKSITIHRKNYLFIKYPCKKNNYDDFKELFGDLLYKQIEYYDLQNYRAEHYMKYNLYKLFKIKDSCEIENYDEIEELEKLKEELEKFKKENKELKKKLKKYKRLKIKESTD